jgi:hypothetical protein
MILKVTRNLVGGTKITFKMLRRELEIQYGKSWDFFWDRMVGCVLKSLCCVVEHMQRVPNAFEGKRKKDIRRVPNAFQGEMRKRL